jgi:hypothetical protein
MPVVPETVVVAGRVGSSPAALEDGWDVWGACAIAAVEKASVTLIALIPNSRLIESSQKGWTARLCADHAQIHAGRRMQLTRLLGSI